MSGETVANDAATTASVGISPFMVLIGLLLALVVALLFYLFQSGVFRNITVETKAGPYGEMTVAYKTGKGPYKNTAKVHSEILSLLGEEDDGGKVDYDKCLPHVGIYYDDPESVPEEDLRYAVGAVLAVTHTQDLDPLKMELLLENGYKVAVLPKQQFAVVSSFPLRTALSLYVAIFRVYPRLRHYIAEMGLCAYPAIEITDKRTMHFMMPLSRQEEFFVPEFCEEQISIATTEMSTAGVDHSALVDEDVLRTSSRNSNYRKSEEKNPDKVGESGDSNANSCLNYSNDDLLFVKPTKPAPKKAKKLQAPLAQVIAQQEIKEIVVEEDEFSSSSFEEIPGEKMSDESEDEQNKMSCQD